ncbi:MAG TPA: hypothetical protein VL326_14850 [Kofleriaceae bacterium]|nr:hypothetical protein [Kofleriaceae bacterium]
MSVRLGILVAIVVVVGASPVYGESKCAPLPDMAATHTAEAVATSKSLFTKGLALQKSRKDAEACKMFESSLVLEPQLGNLLNVADCRERAGQLVEARGLFALAAEFAKAHGDRRARFAGDRVSALDKKLVRVDVRIADPATPGFALRVAGCPVVSPSAELHTVAAPGTVVVDASAPGRKSFHVEENGAAGDLIAIAVPVLGPERDSEAERKAKEAEALAAVENRKAEQLAVERERVVTARYVRHPARRWAKIAGLVGIGALVTGAAFGIQTYRLQSSFDDAGCGDIDRPVLETTFATCRDQASSGERDAVLANVLFVGGAVTLGIAAVVIVVDPGGGTVERPDAARTTLVVSPRGIGAVVRW